MQSELSAPRGMSLKVKHSLNTFHLQTMSPSASTLKELSPPSTPSLLTASPVPPFYTSSPSHTSSSPMYPTHSKPQPFCEDDTGNEQLAPHQNSTQFDMSSTCPCHGSCMPAPTTPEVKITRASFESVSLEQHLQHVDVGREEAMQSFILERFLPAAKAVATDHDRTIYTASKHHAMKPSLTSHMSLPKLTKNTSRLHSIPSTSSASKGVTWSSPLSRDDDEMECSDEEEPTKSSGFFCVGLKTAISRVHKVVHTSTSRSKSRAARSSSHKASSDEEEDVLPKVNVLVQGMQKQRNAHTTASSAFSSNSHTIKAIQQGRPSSCMASSRSTLSRSGCAGQDGSSFVSITSLDATPLHNMSVNYHSISPSQQQQYFRCNCSKQSPFHDNACQRRLMSPKESSGGTRLKDYPFRCNCSKQSPLQDNVCQRCSRSPCDQHCASCAKESPSATRLKDHPFRCNCSKQSPLQDNAYQRCLRSPCDQCCASCAKESPGGTRLKDYPFRCNCSKQSPLQDNACQRCLRSPCDQCCASCAKESPGGTRLKDYPLQKTSRCTASDVSVQDSATRASIKGSTVCRDAVEGALRDPDDTEDNEHEFYDAFDSWSSRPGDVTPLTCTSPKSPKKFGSSRKWTPDKDAVVDVPSYIETPHAFDITGKISDYDGNYEGLSKYFSEKQEEMEGKESLTKCLSCEGCASAGSAHTAALKQKRGKIRADRGKERFSQMMNGTYSSNPSSPPTIFYPKCQSGTPNGHKKWLSPPEPGWPLGISSVQSGTKKSSVQEHTKHDERCVANSVSAFTESSVPSSPSVPPSPTGSWLGKAMALNASKSSTLATLQQKEKAESARKKLEFTLSDAKKEVKWEDVVKGSQMHPERFRVSEELQHSHPSNRNAIKT